MKRMNNRGFHAVALLPVIVVVVAIGFIGYKVASKDSVTKTETTNITEGTSTTDTTKVAETPAGQIWMMDGDSWKASQTPPACPEPLVVPTPVDISKATAILYPGQYRGTDYKSHGGFVFRGQANDAITVKVPLDSYVYKASRYIEQGEVQYFFVFIAPCGIMYRFDHLLTLSPEFQKLADTLPAAKVDDSRTTSFDPAPLVKAGDVVATAIGFKTNNNTSVDFGVYDLRQKNAASKTSSWQQAHPNENEFGTYAICWLDYLPSADKAIAKALPGGDGKSGKTSDYCK